MPTNGMTIDSLNTVSALTAQDEVPVWDKEASGEPTKKITAQNMTNSVKTLGSLVNTTEMNTAIAQSTATTHNQYTHANGAVIDCYRSGNIVTVRVTNIGASTPIEQNTSFLFDTGMDTKYKPPVAVYVYGNKRGNYSGSDSIRYTLSSDGSISGYAYGSDISSGSFFVTYIK